MMRYLPTSTWSSSENRTDKEQQVWNVRYEKRKLMRCPAAAFGGLGSVRENGKAEVSWKHVAGGATCHVFRGEGDAPWRLTFKEVTPKPAADGKFTDQACSQARSITTTLATMKGRDLGAPSLRVRAQPRLNPRLRADVLAKDKVAYSWKPSDEKDVSATWSSARC